MSYIIVPRSLGQPLNLGHWSTDGLVFYWRGIPDEKALDESLLRNHGTIVGPTWVADGLYFDGNSQYVSLPFSIAALPITVGVWVKAEDDNPVASQYFFYFGDSESGSSWYSLSFGTDGTLRIWSRDTGASFTSTVDYADGQWHFVVGQFIDDGTNRIVRLYVDGQFLGSASSGNASEVGTYDTLAIGMVRDDSPSGPFAGWMRNVSVYTRALFASEIQQLYMNPDLPMQKEPVWLASFVAAPPVTGLTGIYYRTLLQGVS